MRGPIFHKLNVIIADYIPEQPKDHKNKNISTNRIAWIETYKHRKQIML
jgi:hypothetical protein